PRRSSDLARLPPSLMGQGLARVTARQEARPPIFSQLLSYGGPLRNSVLVATASAFLRDRRRSSWAFPGRCTNPRPIRKQIRRGYQSCFLAPATNASDNLIKKFDGQLLPKLCTTDAIPLTPSPLP